MSQNHEKDVLQRGLTAGLAAVLSLSGAFAGNAAQDGSKQEKKQSAIIVVEGKYYCNTKALNAQERAKHKQLTEKLLRQRAQTVETEKGYEFQYNPESLSVAEVAEWVVMESKCCPFFDFHIDLERAGKLVCLRLTGGEGVKAFIRSEFGLH